MVGASKGAQIALAMVSLLKNVAAVVCISGLDMVNEPASFKYKDLVVPAAVATPEYVKFDAFGALSFRNLKFDTLVKQNQKSVIPVEKAEGQILFIVGENDECVNSKLYAERCLAKLQHHGKNNGRMLAYPGAGHIIEPPYSPLCYASRNPGFPFPLLWGGDLVAHAAAQEHAWAEVQKFLRHHLTETKSKL